MSYEAVECFWVEPTGKALRTLRRYSKAENGECPAHPGTYSRHDVSIEIGADFEVIWNDEPDGARYVAALSVEDFGDDERWPTHCACGYEFRVDDNWQVNQEPVYSAADGREAWTSPANRRKPTPGAMFDTFWRPRLRKEDGLCVSVVCPDGQVWCIDDEATSGGFWTRTGTVPKITAEPSIQTGSYHGWLRDGVLSASI